MYGNLYQLLEFLLVFNLVSLKIKKKFKMCTEESFFIYIYKRTVIKYSFTIIKRKLFSMNDIFLSSHRND